jgi:hypothetical protein
MFFAPGEPPEIACAELRTLRLSLNAPVVAVEELPVGPARAGIALGAGPEGEPHLTVAVRSLRGGRLAYYVATGELGESADLALALEAALSFAEGMGFLFDEDEVEARGAAGPAEAARLWRELIGAEGPVVDREARAEPVLLERALEAEAASTARSPLPLTKFRRSPATGVPAFGRGD